MHPFISSQGHTAHLDAFPSPLSQLVNITSLTAEFLSVDGHREFSGYKIDKGDQCYYQMKSLMEVCTRRRESFAFAHIAFAVVAAANSWPLNSPSLQIKLDVSLLSPLL